MARRKVNMTRLHITRTVTQMVLQKGYSTTTFRDMAQALDTRVGLVNFYFPNKDDLLALIVDRLCKFQWKMIEKEAGEGISSVLAICLELMSMAAAAEEDAIAKDIFVSSYQSTLCLEIIQENDFRRAVEVFGPYNPDWSEEDFRAAETMVSGIEYALLNSNSKSASLEKRIPNALDTILSIYNVPEEIRKANIEKVVEMDYRAIGKRIFKEFAEFSESEDRHELEKVLG